MEHLQLQKIGFPLCLFLKSNGFKGPFKQMKEFSHIWTCVWLRVHYQSEPFITQRQPFPPLKITNWPSLVSSWRQSRCHSAFSRQIFHSCTEQSKDTSVWHRLMIHSECIFPPNTANSRMIGRESRKVIAPYHIVIICKSGGTAVESCQAQLRPDHALEQKFHIREILKQNCTRLKMHYFRQKVWNLTSDFRQIC